MRRLIRLAIYLFIVLVVLAVAGILLLNTIVKQVIESRLRTATGMDVRVGAVDVGLLSPTVTFENFKIYNTADFGGSLFMDMPELHIEYSLSALRAGNLHFKLVRLNLAEVDIVQDKNGRLNVQGVMTAGNNGGQRAPASNGTVSIGNGMKFTGIDTFNLTLGKFRMSNLGSGHDQEIEFGIKNQITHNVKSPSDLPAVNLVLATRAAASSSSTNSSFDISKLLNVLTGH